MTVSGALHEFATDPKVWAAVALLALDLILGVAAAIYRRRFRFAYLADFLRTDVLGKLVPYFGLWWAQRVVPDVGADVAAGAAYAALAAALAGSVTSSLADLGVRLPAALGQGEKPALP